MFMSHKIQHILCDSNKSNKINKAKHPIHKNNKERKATMLCRMQSMLLILPIFLSFGNLEVVYASSGSTSSSSRSKAYTRSISSFPTITNTHKTLPTHNSNYDNDHTFHEVQVKTLPPPVPLSLSILSTLRGGGSGSKKQVMQKRTGSTSSSNSRSSDKRKRKRKKIKKKIDHEMDTKEDVKEEVETEESRLNFDDGDDDGEDDEDHVKSGKSVIKKALKEDPATAMGDAIRARASDLLEDDISHSTFHHNDMTFHSISFALGSSEQQSQKQRNKKRLQEEQQNQHRDPRNKPGSNRRIPSTSTMQDGGGVQPSSSAVIANYFLKSHGGLHGIQSIMSFLSVIFGISSIAINNINQSNIINNNNNPQQLLSLKIRLIQRTLLCALSKHISGFIAAATASANRIPDIGWRETRLRMDRFALDPVSQYLFYCCILVLWTNGVAGTFGSGDVSSLGKVAAGASASTALVSVPWWLKGSRNFYCTLCLIGPILLREIISTIWVIADVLVLQLSSNLDSTTTTASDSNTKNPSIVLKSGTTIIDSIMSLLLTPQQWRNANAATKQKLLARLVSKLSVGMEIGTGVILVYDAIRASIDFSISPVASRPSIVSVMKRLLCARLYINFLLVRRKKVVDLVNGIRGGFVHVPTRVLDIMLEPGKAMGLDWDSNIGTTGRGRSGGSVVNDEKDEVRPKSGIEWLGYLAGF